MKHYTKWTKELDKELLELISESLSTSGKYAPAYKEFIKRHPEFTIWGATCRWQGTLKKDNNVRVIRKVKTPKKNCLMLLISRVFKRFIDTCCLFLFCEQGGEYSNYILP